MTAWYALFASLLARAWFGDQDSLVAELSCNSVQYSACGVVSLAEVVFMCAWLAKLPL
jgi:hypothetical protein